MTTLTITSERLDDIPLLLHELLGTRSPSRQWLCPWAAAGRLPSRADFIRVYGIQPRHWMPAYASMTSKRSFPRKRESRSRTYNRKPL
jgi:hypothetical protein